MPELGPVAFIGLGNMGLPMAGRLLTAGFDVRGFDVSREARERLATTGATAVTDAAEAARGAEFVVLMLPNSTIVTSVVESMLAAGSLGSGSIVVDMSSSEPQSTRRLAERLTVAGTTLVDAPVSGGVTGAVNGTLTIMVGGTDAALERAQPVLAELGTPVHCGEVGAGHAVKALNNLLSATHLWATSEVMEAGAAFGLDPQVMLSVFNRSSGRSGSTENKWPNFVLPGTYDSGFGLGLMLKDMRIALSLAESTGVARDMSAVAVQLWSRAAEGSAPGADHTEVARWVAEHAPEQRTETAAPPRGEGHEQGARPHDG